MKKCTKCSIEREDDQFAKNGSRCKICLKEYKKKYYELNKEKILKRVKEYTEENIEKVRDYKNEYNKKNPNKEYHKEYREKNKESISLKRKQYYQQNKEKVKQKVREYNSENRQYINKRKRENREKNKEKYNENTRQYIQNRKESDPIYKLKCAIRTLISQSFKGQFTKKSKKTIEILGCDFITFSDYIESQFTENMNWDNYAEYWQLDHKIPISWARTEEEVYRLNHYSNFQPLHWKDNISKGNRWSD